MRIAWMNDIHLEFLDQRALTEFLDEIRGARVDGALVGGDIGQAHSVCGYLKQMEEVVQCPIYFVLGNHDFYHGSIEQVRSSVGKLVNSQGFIRWLNTAGVVRLTDRTCLVGHGGWGDGRLGDFFGSNVQLNDFVLIEELSGLPRDGLLARLHSFGEEAAEHFRNFIPQALGLCDHVVVLTHVPPFTEAAWHDGRLCDDDWLPFFCCKAVGDVLKEVMSRHKGKHMTVLCGHTHGGGTSHILTNLVTHTGPARYRHPKIQRVFQWD